MNEIESIRARHQGAKPDPTANPAWANAEVDIGRLLAAYDAQTIELATYKETLAVCQDRNARARYIGPENQVWK
jgi:hypothetical protein